MPSIILAAELPKNLLRGLRVPSTRMWCSGAMKKYDDFGGWWQVCSDM